RAGSAKARTEGADYRFLKASAFTKAGCSRHVHRHRVCFICRSRRSLHDHDNGVLLHGRWLVLEQRRRLAEEFETFVCLVERGIKRGKVSTVEDDLTIGGFVELHSSLGIQHRLPSLFPYLLMALPEGLAGKSAPSVEHAFPLWLINAGCGNSWLAFTVGRGAR